METKKGYTKTKIGWIPEDWDVVKLGKHVDIYSGQSPAKFEFTTKGKLKFFKVNQLNYCSKYLTKSEYSYDNNKFNNYSKGMIIFPKRGAAIFTNKLRILNIEGFFDTNLMGLKVKDSIHNEFLYYFLYKFELSNIADTSSVPQINNKHINPILLPSPPLPEQQKIAEILSAIDDKILSIEDQIQQTEQLKKGLMEKLLTEGIGHTEFEDTEIGRIPASWGFGVLGKNVKLMGGYAFKSKDSQGHGIKWLKIANVSPSKIIWEDKSYLPSKYLDTYEKFVLNEDDIVIAMTRPLLGRKLKLAYIRKEDSNSLLNQRVGKFIFTNKEVIPDFFYFLIQSSNFIDSMLVKLSGSDPPNISSEMIESILVVFPPLPEQKQIATILSIVDDKLDVLQSKRTGYETLKKGLMEQLLTGERRVKL